MNLVLDEVEEVMRGEAYYILSFPPFHPVPKHGSVCLVFANNVKKNICIHSHLFRR